MKTEPMLGLYCVCDPNGVLVHTTVGVEPRDCIEEWLHTEQSMNFIGNLGRQIRGETKRCAPSWEGYEAEGYRIVRVNLIPA